MPTIGIVAGEASGDLLGSHLIRALKKHRPDLEFIGIAGPKMQAEGAKSLFPMEKLAVRGYFEVLRHLFEILRIRRQLRDFFRKNPPDIFIPLFQDIFWLELERQLKELGVKTIHYVSPSIWAWRKGRMRKIRRSVSHILALFPFEAPMYERAGVPVTYVGHPLADMLPLHPDQAGAQSNLKIRPGKLVIALLPGSRQSELDYMADLFVRTALEISRQAQDVHFLLPVVSREARWKIEAAIARHEAYDLPVTILFGHAHQAMEAADAVIVASGTATLEAALLKRPMVITYRMSPLSWQILRHMNYLPYVGLPNILTGRSVVPELLQQEATPERLAETVMKLVHDKDAVAGITRDFTYLHHLLKQNTEEKAAKVVLDMLP